MKNRDEIVYGLLGKPVKAKDRKKLLKVLKDTAAASGIEETLQVCVVIRRCAALDIRHVLPRSPIRSRALCWRHSVFGGACWASQQCRFDGLRTSSPHVRPTECFGHAAPAFWL